MCCSLKQACICAVSSNDSAFSSWLNPQEVIYDVIDFGMIQKALMVQTVGSPVREPHSDSSGSIGKFE